MNANPSPRLLRRIFAPTAMILAVLLGGTACVPLFPTPGQNGSQASQDPAVIQNVPANLKSFYTQKVSWSNCEGNMLCSKVTVPMDYRNPQRGSIELAVLKLPASGIKEGSLLLDPGGPGASGYDMLADSAALFSAKLRGSFDLVGFDPRGVKRSAPVRCLSDSAIDQQRQESFDLDTDSDVAAYEIENKADIAECVKNTGPVLGLIDTASSVKDMDILRAILNEKELDYFGFSYGTKLGASYAEQFPDKVGKFVLDGALDPTLTEESLGMGQAKAFEAALHSWAENCIQAAECPFHGDVAEAVQQIRELNASYQKTPQRTHDGRVLTGAEFNSGLSLAMYSTNFWDSLKKALADALGGDPNAMMALADYAVDRDPKSGKYDSNSTFAFAAINCLDYQMNTDLKAMRTESKRLQAVSPTFGKYFGYSGLICKDWPYKSKAIPHPIAAKGAGPIVVIGTTGDPATPYQWAQALRKQLSSAVLVTWNGNGHTAYGHSNSCIDDAVDSYFVNGTTPPDGLTC